MEHESSAVTAFCLPNWRTYHKWKQHREKLELREGKTPEKAQEQNLNHGAEFFTDQALSLWSRSTDSTTLDYQRTNSMEYQIVRTHKKETI